MLILNHDQTMIKLVTLLVIVSLAAGVLVLKQQQLLCHVGHACL
jgi:hypothetical protein